MNSLIPGNLYKLKKGFQNFLSCHMQSPFIKYLIENFSSPRMFLSFKVNKVNKINDIYNEFYFLIKNESMLLHLTIQETKNVSFIFEEVNS